jgi:hypothetical protein
MKKLILVFTAIAITAGTYAQNDSASRKMRQTDINPNDSLGQYQEMNNQNQIVQNNLVGKSFPDGVMMHNGKMMKVKNGKMTVLDQDMTLSNGTKLMSNGTCIKKNGSKMILKEGQHIDMSGNMIDMKINRDKNKQLDRDSTKKKYVN